MGVDYTVYQLDPVFSNLLDAAMADTVGQDWDGRWTEAQNRVYDRLQEITSWRSREFGHYGLLNYCRKSFAPHVYEVTSVENLVCNCGGRLDLEKIESGWRIFFSIL